jgi:hypothetical protein
MHKDATKRQRAGRQTWNKLIHELIAIDTVGDCVAVGLFTLLGLALSVAVLRAIPLTAQSLDLLTAGS